MVARVSIVSYRFVRWFEGETSSWSQAFKRLAPGLYLCLCVCMCVCGCFLAAGLGADFEIKSHVPLSGQTGGQACGCGIKQAAGWHTRWYCKAVGCNKLGLMIPD